MIETHKEYLVEKENPIGAQVDHKATAKKPKPVDELLNFTNSIYRTLQHKGTEYDKGKERSMPQIIAAFNAITGNTLTITEGYFFMMVLKMVREGQVHKHDNVLDLACYAALLGEESNKIKQPFLKK